MTLQQLTYFVTVARERNFTRAAAVCHVAQPALSQQIAKLEVALGASVFVRTKRSVQLTAVGLDFLGYAERCLELLSEGKRRISDMKKLRLGLVTVLCTPTIATYWLPRVIVRYRKLYPSVEMRIVEQPGCAPQDLGESRADLGIVQIEPRLSSRASQPLHEEPLFVDEPVLVMPATHVLSGVGRARHTAIPFASVDGQSFILPKAPCGVAAIAARAFSLTGIRPKVVLETNQVEAVCQMVSAGLGLGLIPRMAMARGDSGLHWRSITAPTLTRTIGMVWLRDCAFSAATTALVELLRAEGKKGDLPAPSFGPPRLVAQHTIARSV